ncbi:MAG TPA: uracil-DNA glycosylase [Planctomycetota bacterium]|nr:uracil-DNA glycosylase [Planctomycetota bacterium]
MDPSVERLLRSMQAAGVRRLPAPRVAPVARSDADAPPPDALRPAARGPAKPGTPSPTAFTPGLFTVGRPVSSTPVSDPATELAAIAREVAECRRCKLCEARNTSVPGEGSPSARIVFVGEGPGADEDRTGRPFVGRAGQLLDDIIVKGMKLRREDVYICNVVKCRPPGNRVPEAEEAAACADFLDRQIAAIRPAVICALGATAVRRLLDDERPLSALRGHVYAYRGIPVIVTYHPAYLLRNPAAKVHTWQDIQKVMELARRA